MRYENVVQGRFLSRPNRFIALVELDGAETVCHVKNTGRCRELLVPGAEVYLVPGVTPGRRTPYDLVAVNKGGRLINMDAQAPNRAFAEFARTFDPQAESIRPEFRFGAARRAAPGGGQGGHAGAGRPRPLPGCTYGAGREARA